MQVSLVTEAGRAIGDLIRRVAAERDGAGSAQVGDGDNATDIQPILRRGRVADADIPARLNGKYVEARGVVPDLKVADPASYTASDGLQPPRPTARRAIIKINCCGGRGGGGG